MQIELVADGSFRRTLKVTAPASTVQAELDKAYTALGAQARLKGFRKGKAPRKVLEARFGPQVASDVATDIIQQAYTAGLTEHELEPVSRPSVDRSDDPVAGEDFHFSISVEVKPSIELETYEGVEVEYPNADVADEEVEAAVGQRLQQSRRLVEVEDRGIEAGDQVMVELRVKDGDDEVAFEPGTMVQTGGDQWYTGIESLLLGLEKDGTASGEVAFAETARTESVAGKTLNAEVKVLSIQAYELPELSDELAEELGFEGGADGMKSSLRDQIQSARDEAAKNQARANLLQALINANPFDVPSGLVDQQLQVLVNELRMQQAYRGVDPRQVNFSQAQLADLRIRSEFAVKGGLILEYVVDKHEIAVEDSDLDAKIEALAAERGQDVEVIRGYFETEDARQELRERLLEEKGLDWLLERAKLVEPAAPEEAPEADEADAASETEE